MNPDDWTPIDPKPAEANDEARVVLLAAEQKPSRRFRPTLRASLFITLCFALVVWLTREPRDDRPPGPTTESQALSQLMDSPAVWQELGSRREWERRERRIFHDMSQRRPVPEIDQINPSGTAAGNRMAQQVQWLIRVENLFREHDQKEGVIHFGKWVFRGLQEPDGDRLRVEFRVFKTEALARKQRDLRLRLADDRNEVVRRKGDRTLLSTDESARLFAQRSSIKVEFESVTQTLTPVPIAETIYDEFLRLCAELEEDKDGL